MSLRIIYLSIVLLLIGCRKNSHTTPKERTLREMSDQCCVKDSTFIKGDVRRYGIYPKRSFTNNQWSEVVKLADRGMPITFNKGMYYGNIILKGVDSITIYFDDATIAGGIQIINNGDVASNSITLSGKLTVLDKVFIRQSSNIKFDELNIISDTLNNIYKKKNRGLSIYAGSKKINIDTLRIMDTGGTDDDFYTYSAAAMQVHGYNNNPEMITVNYLKIKNAARSALYLTGNNHKIEKVEINNFGYGSNNNMFGLEDAKPEAQKVFSGAWFNKCNDCTIDTLMINAKKGNKTYSARFDLGVYSKPCIINTIKFNSIAKQMPIEDDVLTNVLVKRVLKDD
ncbi:hypothetical protein [Winogradskyella sp. J14-2]|uniref:hypothetical protein n=1 Tax=Winogradskyella sp. J14-2 TaxID=1936080 RepID=UPI0012FA3CB2|nr:hypothetical protein [Winogradskyella sp. J14-2]